MAFWIVAVLWSAIVLFPLAVVVYNGLLLAGFPSNEQTLGMAVGFSLVVALGWFGSRTGLYFPFL